MSETVCLYKKILFPTDFSEASRYALFHAVNLARMCHAELYLVHVIYDIAAFQPHVAHPCLDQFIQEMIDAAKNEIDTAYIEELRGYDKLEKVVLRGSPSEVINDFARKNHIDIIVIGSVGRTGLEKIFFGNTADKVMRRAPCPVLVVRMPEHHK